jgi:pyruvate formate lyase activating enzyme
VQLAYLERQSDVVANVVIAGVCNLNCPYCFAADHMRAGKTDVGHAFISTEAFQERLDFLKRSGINEIRLIGGEPTLHPHLEELVHWLRELGFKVKLDTNGSQPETLAKLLPAVDYVAMDYKAPLERYPAVTDCPSLELERLCESVKLLIDWGGSYEFRTTIVEGIHSEQDILAICRELAGGRRYVLQGYVPSPGVVPQDGLPTRRTPMSVLRRLHEICREHFEETILRGA